MNHLYTMLALDIANTRAREAAQMRRSAELGRGRPGVVRRGLANGFARVSRGSAAAVRRLDECTADDLSQALATGK
jgi:hypothetical protein